LLLLQTTKNTQMDQPRLMQYKTPQMVLRGIAYDSSTKGKCADTKESETTENCEAGKWGSTNVRTTAIIDGREKDKKVSFDNVT